MKYVGKEVRIVKEWLRKFMYGRYGVDALTNTLLWSAMALLIIDVFAETMILYVVGLCMLVFAYYRSFARRYEKRRAENRWFLDTTAGIRGVFAKSKRLFYISYL